MTKEVMLDKFFLRDPKLFSVVVDDCILVGVSVGNKGTGRGSEEVRETVS